MGVAEGDRPGLVVERVQRGAHRRHDRALEQIRRAAQVEPACIDPVEDRGVVLLQLLKHRLQEALPVLVVGEAGEDLQIAAGNVLEKERRRHAAEGQGWDLDQLALARRDRQGDAARLRRGYARIEPDAEHALRPVVGRHLRAMLEHLPERALAGRDHDEVETAGETGDILGGDLAVFDGAAARLEEAHQLGQVDPVVDGTAGRLEIAAEPQRLRTAEIMVVADIVNLVVVPGLDAEGMLALQRHVVMGDRVHQPHVPVIFGRPVGDDGRGDIVLAQPETQLQASHAGPHDADRLVHLLLPLRAGCRPRLLFWRMLTRYGVFVKWNETYIIHSKLE